MYLMENFDLLIRETSDHLCVLIIIISMVSEICKLRRFLKKSRPLKKFITHLKSILVPKYCITTNELSQLAKPLTFAKYMVSTGYSHYTVIW